MRALKLVGPGRLELQEVPVPEIGDDDILVLPAWYRLLWRRDTLRKGSGSSQAAEHQRQRQAPGTHEVRPMPHMHLSYERGKPATSG